MDEYLRMSDAGMFLSAKESGLSSQGAWRTLKHRQTKECLRRLSTQPPAGVRQGQLWRWSWLVLLST